MPDVPCTKPGYGDDIGITDPLTGSTLSTTFTVLGWYARAYKKGEDVAVLADADYLIRCEYSGELAQTTTLDAELDEQSLTWHVEFANVDPSTNAQVCATLYRRNGEQLIYIDHDRIEQLIVNVPTVFEIGDPVTIPPPSPPGPEVASLKGGSKGRVRMLEYSGTCPPGCFVLATIETLAGRKVCTTVCDSIGKVRGRWCVTFCNLPRPRTRYKIHFQLWHPHRGRIHQENRYWPQ